MWIWILIAALYIFNLYAAYRLGRVKYQVKQTNQVLALFKKQREDLNWAKDNEPTEENLTKHFHRMIEGMANIILGRNATTPFYEEVEKVPDLNNKTQVKE